MVFHLLLLLLVVVNAILIAQAETGVTHSHQGSGIISRHTLDVTGGNDGSEQNEALFKLEDEIHASFSSCGIDLNRLQPSVDGSPSLPAYFEMVKLSRPCSATEETALRQALLNFEDCSEYEALELEEDLLDAIIGAMLKCINSMSAVDMAMLNLPETCAIALFGNHPLGQMLRDWLLRPEGTEKCFSNLASQVPLCSIDLWPNPVDGKSIQTVSCLGAKMEDILEEECVDGLAKLSGCLPPISTTKLTPTQCNEYTTQCGDDGDALFAVVLMSLPRTLRGMPLPQSCQDVSKTHDGYTDIVDRYEIYRTHCASSGKALWELLEQRDHPSNPPLRTIKEFIRLGDGAIPGSYEKAASPLNAPAAGRSGQDEKTSSSGGGGSFGFGVLTGFLLVGVGYGLLLFVSKQRGIGDRISLPGYVELPSF